MDESLLDEAVAARGRFIEAQHGSDQARAEYHYAIRRLHASGGSMREIAHELGISHQRVHQIIDEADADRAAKNAKNAKKKTLLQRIAGSTAQRCEATPEDRPVRQMFDRMSGEAREAMTLAQDQARSLGHHYIGTEHILLGLLCAQHGVTAQVLTRAGATERQTRDAIVRIIGRGKGEQPIGPLRLTPRSKKVLEFARKQAKHDRCTHVSSEHILLGLLREGNGVGAQILTQLGADHDRLRRRLGQASLACSFCGRVGAEVAQLISGPGVQICERCVAEATVVAARPRTESAHAPLTAVSPSQEDTACSFCGRKPTAPDWLVAGPGARICNQCLALCREINAEEGSPNS